MFWIHHSRRTDRALAYWTNVERTNASLENKMEVVIGCHWQCTRCRQIRTEPRSYPPFEFIRRPSQLLERLRVPKSSRSSRSSEAERGPLTHWEKLSFFAPSQTNLPWTIEYKNLSSKICCSSCGSTAILLFPNVAHNSSYCFLNGLSKLLFECQAVFWTIRTS